MDDPRWLRVVAVGLVLASLAVVYFLFTGRFSVSKSRPSQTQTTQVIKPSPSASPSPTPTSAYSAIVNRTQGGAQTLPRTGFPVGMAVVFSISSMISGFSLRKFPK